MIVSVVGRGMVALERLKCRSTAIGPEQLALVGRGMVALERLK